MRVLLTGPPASGKATHALAIREHYAPRHICYIDPTDLSRQAVAAQNALGRRIQRHTQAGEVVPDAVTVQLIHQRISESNDCDSGFILDGFPRTTEQAELLNGAGMGIDGVVQIKLSDERALDRVAHRWVHRASGRVYHDKYFPPKASGKDDVTGEPLSQRHDDQLEVAKLRLEAHKKSIESLKNYFGIPSSPVSAPPRAATTEPASTPPAQPPAASTGAVPSTTASSPTSVASSSPAAKPASPAVAWVVVEGNSSVETVQKNLLKALQDVEKHAVQARRSWWKFW